MAAPINCIAQHIVLDLETLSTAPNAAVISIGAVALDGYGTCVSEFHVAIDGHGQPGRDIDTKTLAWWANQSPEAQAASLHATDYVSATHAMGQFSGWVYTHADPNTVKVWGNGSSFDCTILASLYAQCHELGHPPPWRYWNDRDMRTILDDFPEAKQVGDFVGIKHHALHDARHEAKQLAKALELRRMVFTDTARAQAQKRTVMIQFFKRLICSHASEREFIRNIYGDEIASHGYKRSIWRCMHCGGLVYSEHLNTDAAQSQAQIQQRGAA